MCSFFWLILKYIYICIFRFIRKSYTQEYIVILLHNIYVYIYVCVCVCVCGITSLVMSTVWIDWAL